MVCHRAVRSGARGGGGGGGGGGDVMNEVVDAARHDVASHRVPIVVGQGEIGGDAAVVASQQADGCTVVCPGSRFLRIIVAHRDARLSQVGNLDEQRACSCRVTLPFKSMLVTAA